MLVIDRLLDCSSLSEDSKIFADELLNRQKKLNCYLLIDPYLREYPSEIKQYYYDRNRLQPFRLIHPEISAEKHPFFIELDLKNINDYYFLRYSHDKAVKETNSSALFEGEGRIYSAFILSDVKALRLSSEICTRSLLEIDRRHFYFRYYDPAVVEMMPEIFNEQQYQTLFAGISAWFYFDRYGRPKEMDHLENISIIFNAIRPDNMQYQQLYCIGIVNQALLLHRDQNPDVVIESLEAYQMLSPYLLQIIDKIGQQEEILVSWAYHLMNDPMIDKQWIHQVIAEMNTEKEFLTYPKEYIASHHIDNN